MSGGASWFTEVPGARPYAALEDMILSVELFTCFILWLRDWTLVVQAREQRMPLFIVYAANLLGASLWCALGVYMHLREPLPTSCTATWLAFLLLGAVTPVLFPLVSVLAFAEPQVAASKRRLQYLTAVFVAMAYSAVAISGADLSLGGLMPDKLWVTPWHTIDGRSYGGAEFGINFDLLSTYPCYRGDSMFVMSSFFVIANTVSVGILCRAAVGKDLPYALQRSARMLAMLVGGMLVNCIALLQLISVFRWSLANTFDVFHAIQGVVMALSFLQLRIALRSPERKAD